MDNNDKKAKLLHSAKELFTNNGYKDTNISKITKLAGMATGTFYNYFHSKDSIFMEIYLEENNLLKHKIMESIDKDDNPMLVMQQMMKLNYEGMMASPILREWYNREAFGKIESSYRSENGLDNMDFLYDSFIEVFEHWQSNGIMRSDIKPAMIMAMFSALINVDLHKDEIGIDYFPEVLVYLSEFTMNGLMNTTNNKE